MAYTHVDLDGGGSNTSPYDTWAKAATTFQAGLTTAAAGGVCAVKGTLETTAATTTYTSPGTLLNPTKIVGVKSGTTNEGSSIAASDLVVRGTDTLPKLDVSGAGNDLKLTGYSSYHGINFTAVDRFQPIESTLRQCEINCAVLRPPTAGTTLTFENCKTTVTASINVAANNNFIMAFYGGEIACTAATLFAGTYGVSFTSVDFSSSTFSNIVATTTTYRPILFKNCRMPASYSLNSSTQTLGDGYIELIGCDSTTTRAATDSIPDYEYEGKFGTIAGQFTIIRTNGADDGASGGFSYEMTPLINATLEGSDAVLKSPWMAVWLAGGSNTVTVYIANDTASTDFNEDEVWVEFYTPDAGDTATHDQNFDPSGARLLDSATIITDDTGSTWGSGGNNHQKMSVTVTTGFEGWAYARLHFAKRYSSNPATLYLDPKIAVT